MTDRFYPFYPAKIVAVDDKLWGCLGLEVAKP